MITGDEKYNWKGKTILIADDDEISIDVDQIGDGSAIGLKVVLIGTRAA